MNERRRILPPIIISESYRGRRSKGTGVAYSIEDRMSALGTKLTSRDVRSLVAIGGKADMAIASADFRF
jgi:hypothetical protein